MRHNIELNQALEAAHQQIRKMLKASTSVADPGSLGVFQLVEDVLTRMVDAIENQSPMDEELLEEFKKVLSISVRAFEGTKLDDLLWKIDAKLKE